MTITRRGFIKRALAAGALALVPSLPRLPKVAQEERKAGQVVALPLHTSKIWNRALSDLEILEQYDIALESQVASAQARTIDAKIMAMLDQTECKDEFVVRFEGWRWSEGCAK